MNLCIDHQNCGGMVQLSSSRRSQRLNQVCNHQSGGDFEENSHVNVRDSVWPIIHNDDDNSNIRNLFNEFQIQPAAS